MSDETQEADAAATAPGERRRRVGQVDHAYRRSIRLTALGTLLPGAGLTRTKRRALGWVMVAGFVVVLLILLILLAVKGPARLALALAARPSLLRDLSISALLVGLSWALSIVATAWITRPQRLDSGRATMHAAFTASMALLIGIPTWWVFANSRATDSAIRSVFQGRGGAVNSTGVSVQAEGDPWEGIPRVNVLLLGSDAGVGREGVRTDSMIVASIDTESGNTVLFGLPRNLQRVPIPKTSPLYADFPKGYNCPDRVARWGLSATCMLNGIWNEAEDDIYAKAFAAKGISYPGRTTLRDVISETTGLRIDYTLIIDLEGFSQLVDAMGGVDINVKVPENDWGWNAIPVGAHWNWNQTRPIDVPPTTDTKMWIQAGQQHLNGQQALWYARTRVFTSDNGDFGRMSRQRCVVSALVRQAQPAVLLTRYQSILKAAGDNIWSDIGEYELPAFAQLTERIRDGKITSLTFTQDNISVGRPDFAAMRAMIQRSIAASLPQPTGSDGTRSGEPSTSSVTSSTTPPPTTTRPSTTTPGSKATTSTTTAPVVAVDVEDAC